MLAAMRILRHYTLAFLAMAAALLAAALPLTQRIPNGADHYFMIDVGETQIVLNTWGTLHATGYPHYVVLGNLLTGAFRLVGVSPLAAAAGVSVLWGLVAAAVMYALAWRLTDGPWLAAGTVVAYTLTRTIWIHHVIAEIYTFGLALLLALLAVALWPPRGAATAATNGTAAGYGRVYWLALLGGLGVAHHRALVMVAPALLYAVWPLLSREPRKLPGVLLRALALGLLGFLPYLYLPLRAWAGADWVYGEPGTLAGLWAQFIGAEASRFIGPPTTLAAFFDNAATINTVLLTDVTLVGLVAGLAGLAAGVRAARYRRPAVTLLLSAGVAYAFHVSYYTDVLSALVLPVTLSLAFGWLFGADLLLRATWAKGVPSVPGHRYALNVVLAVVALAWGAVAVARNAPFIHAQVTNPAGLAIIEQVRGAPPGSVVMLPWGPLHFAVGYAVDVSGELAHITLVDHQANYRAAANAGRLVVPAFVQYRYPTTWWEAQLGGPVYPVAVAPGLVKLRTTPDRIDGAPVQIDATLSREALHCHANALTLDLIWWAPATVERDLSVFVHLLDADGTLLAQDDRTAPVYGWRPLTTWTPGELIHDLYTLPHHPDAARVRYGLYEQTADGGFVNVLEHELEVDCANGG